jgi:hypothetical protein
VGADSVRGKGRHPVAPRGEARRQVGALEAKDKLDYLLELVERGEEVIITRELKM